MPIISGVLRDDETIFTTAPSQLSASQEYVFQYLIPIIATMEKVPDNYNEDDVDEDNYEHTQVRLLIALLYTIVLYEYYWHLKYFILTLTYEL